MIACAGCGGPKESSRQKSRLCRACDKSARKPRPEATPNCLGCGGPKESSRQKSRLCRACDRGETSGAVKVTATLTPDAYAALVAAARAAKRTPDEHLTVLALGKFAPKT